MMFRSNPQARPRLVILFALLLVIGGALLLF